MEWIDAPWFSLRHTLECGQFFRWRRAGDLYEVTLRDRTFLFGQDGERLLFEGADPAAVRHFFALDHDLPAIHAALGRDPVLAEALERYRGLRIVRQDPWECVAAFLTSMASNIPRITRNVKDMAAAFGTPPAFPRPEQMGSEADLRALRLGFRARYLAAAARLARDGRLDRLGERPGDGIREALMEIPGIAEKVADCVALFAYGRLESFPVDTWIRKAVRKLYFRNRRVTDRKIREFARRRFGPHAGYAQQYLFIWWRDLRPSAQQSAINSQIKKPSAVSDQLSWRTKAGRGLRLKADR